MSEIAIDIGTVCAAHFPRWCLHMRDLLLSISYLNAQLANAFHVRIEVWGASDELYGDICTWEGMSKLRSHHERTEEQN